jgi:hypothetical protein
VSISGGRDKENMIYVCHGILLAITKDEILSIGTTWIELEDIMLRE